MKTPILALDDIGGLRSSSGRAWGMLRDEGYLYLEGAMVADLPVADIEQAARAFFAQSHEYKMRYYIGNSPIHRGYHATGDEGDPACEPDLKEGFDTGLQNLGRPIAEALGTQPQVAWPDIPFFLPAVRRYLEACDGLARCFATILSCSFGLGSDYLNSRAKRPPSQLRLLRYPPSLSHQTEPSRVSRRSYAGDSSGWRVDG